MENENNKMILQSYSLTTIRNDFGIYAQRLIVRIAEAMQYRFEEADFLTKELKPSDERLIWKFNLADLQQPGEKHHAHVKEELRKVIKASVKMERENGWRESVIFTDIDYSDNGQIIVWINQNLWQLFVEISKGFKKYQLETALSLRTTYALRLYQLLSGNEAPITYTIDWLKQMFQLQDKYANNNDFIKRVIEPARKELDEKSETSFVYRINWKKGRGRASIESLTFKTVKTNKELDKEIQHREITRKYGLQLLSNGLVNKLEESYEFTLQGIASNSNIFHGAEMKMKNPTLLEFLNTKRAEAYTKNNPQGWIIKAIQYELAKIMGNEDIHD